MTFEHATSTFTPTEQRATDGLWVHTGRFIVNKYLELRSGTQSVVITVEAWNAIGSDSSALEARVAALESRVSALEARPVIDAVEDLVYGN
ncbi:MAG TPA: hypothetical protein VN903_09170 [Polyangia bacterium]|nr:hypothetical protein [Polyangia bacterium]